MKQYGFGSYNWKGAKADKMPAGFVTLNIIHVFIMYIYRLTRVTSTCR